MKQFFHPRSFLMASVALTGVIGVLGVLHTPVGAFLTGDVGAAARTPECAQVDQAASSLGQAAKEVESIIKDTQQKAEIRQNEYQKAVSELPKDLPVDERTAKLKELMEAYVKDLEPLKALYVDANKQAKERAASLETVMTQQAACDAAQKQGAKPTAPIPGRKPTVPPSKEGGGGSGDDGKSGLVQNGGGAGVANTPAGLVANVPGKIVANAGDAAQKVVGGIEKQGRDIVGKIVSKAETAARSKAEELGTQAATSVLGKEGLSQVKGAVGAAAGVTKVVGDVKGGKIDLNAIGGAADAVGKAAGDIVGADAMKSIQGATTEGAKELGAVFGEAGEGIRDVAKQASAKMNEVKGNACVAVEEARSGVFGAIDEATKAISDVAKQATDAVGGALSAVKDAGKELVGNVTSAVSSVTGPVLTEVSSALGDLGIDVDLGAAGDMIKGSMNDIMTAQLPGVTDPTTLMQAKLDMVNNIKNGVGYNLGCLSPTNGAPTAPVAIPISASAAGGGGAGAPGIKSDVGGTKTGQSGGAAPKAETACDKAKQELAAVEAKQDALEKKAGAWLAKDETHKGRVTSFKSEYPTCYPDGIKYSEATCVEKDQIQSTRSTLNGQLDVLNKEQEDIIAQNTQLTIELSVAKERVDAVCKTAKKTNA